MATNKSIDHGQPAPSADSTRPSGPTVAAEDLLRGRKEVVITHKDDRYILRLTRQDKLVLNK